MRVRGGVLGGPGGGRHGLPAVPAGSLLPQRQHAAARVRQQPVVAARDPRRGRVRVLAGVHADAVVQQPDVPALPGEPFLLGRGPQAKV
eukprot:2828578-Rhodomonas_salina.3